MTATVIELTAADERHIGVAEALAEPEIEPSDSGGSADIDGREPPEPPQRGRGRRRPDRPPSWMRWVLYGIMLIAAFVVQWLISKVWTRVDLAAWGGTPLFGAAREV